MPAFPRMLRLKFARDVAVKTWITICLLGCVGTGFGSDRLQRTGDDPFQNHATLVPGDGWQDLGSRTERASDSWQHDLYSQAILALELQITADGTVLDRPTLKASLVNTLQDGQYDVLVDSADWSRADSLLTVDVRVSTLGTKRQNYVRAVAVSDFYLEDLHQNRRRYWLKGPTAEWAAPTGVVATDEAIRRLERQLILSIRQELLMLSSQKGSGL